MAEENSKPQTRREFEEYYTPLWIKIFGGSILSISFLCVITLTGYIVSNVNIIQSQVNYVNAEIATYKEKSNSLDSNITKLQEENKQLQKDVQLIRERMAAIEGKKENDSQKKE